MAFRGIQSTNIISTDVGLTDPLLILNKDGSTAVDVGFLGKIGATSYAGLVKDSATDGFILVGSITLSPNTVNDISALEASLVEGDLTAGSITATSFTGDGSALTGITDTDTTYTAGTNVTISGSNVISATDTNTTYVDSDWNHDSLTGFVANEHIDWTTDQGATNIHTGNYTNDDTIYTSFNTDFDTRLATKSTTNLAEGTNLYYTDARARQAISVSGDLSYNSTTGVISSSGLASSTTDDLAEGSTNLYYTDARADARIDNWVGLAPTGLDTLVELSTALGNDVNFSTTVTNSIAAKLPLAGGTMTGNLSFGDNNQIRLGDSNDLAIYHDGNNSVINEEGNGTLLIQSNGSGVNIQKGTSEIMAVFRTDSSVDLYHNNVVKLETASAGIDVTGRMYSSTGVFGASDGDRIDMSSNKLGVEIGGTRRMHIDSTGVGIGTNTPTESLTLNSSSNTRLLLQEGGASKGQLAGGGGGLYIQNLTGDTIFRNSSDADTVRIKDDGKVGIGTTSPTGILHVDGHTGSLPSIFEGNGSGDEVPVQLKVKANDGSLSTQGLYGSAGSVSTDNYITLGNSGTSGIQVDNSGNAIVTGTLTATGGIVTDERTADLILKIDASQNSSAISLDPTGDVPNEMTATHGTYAGTDAWSFNGSNWIRWHADSRFASSGDYTIMIFAYHTSNDRDVLWSSYTNAQNSIVGGSTFNWCSDPNGNYHNNPPGANYQGNWYNLNEWRFHCIRYTASNGVHEIFVDGYSSAVSTTTPNFDVVGHYGDTAIGSRNDGIEQYTGYISAAWWYDAPLTNSQISRIYEIHKIRHSIDRTFI